MKLIILSFLTIFLLVGCGENSYNVVSRTENYTKTIGEFETIEEMRVEDIQLRGTSTYLLYTHNKTGLKYCRSHGLSNYSVAIETAYCEAIKNDVLNKEKR